MHQDKKLVASVVDGRPGYTDAQGQTFAAPVSTKRADTWKSKLKGQGYELP